jgi:hypothetical protein
MKTKTLLKVIEEDKKKKLRQASHVYVKMFIPNKVINKHREALSQLYIILCPIFFMPILGAVLIATAL